MTFQERILSRLTEITDIPSNVRDVARLHFADAVGVGLAATASFEGQPWVSYGRAVGSGGGSATILGQNAGASPSNAALVNGGLIHSLEYDDTHTASVVHGSSVLAPAALAVAQSVGASGLAMMRAYVLWYEVLIRLGLAAKGGYQARGFQITSVGGAIAAAGVAADLYGIEAERASAALGISLSQASGVFEFLSNGSSVKSMHPGWAAHAGLIAADLARVGITGPRTALEGRFGLLNQFADTDDALPRLEEIIGTLGNEWHLLDVAFKFFPACHYIHPFAEAAGRLAEAGVSADQISELVFHVPPPTAPIICEPWDVRKKSKLHAARWSLPVCFAIRIVTGKLDLASFEIDPPEQAMALASRCEWRAMTSHHFPDRFEAGVTAKLKSGDQREIYIDDVYGNSSRPADEADIMAKLRDNAARLGKTALVSRLCDVLGAIDTKRGPVDLGNVLNEFSEEA